MSALFYDGVDHMIEKITTLIKGKANNSHTHTKNDITDFPTLGTASSKDVASSGNASATQVVMGNDTRLSDARKASDVYAWAKASSKPSYTKSEIGLGNVDNTSDSSKPVSTAQQTAIDTAYANANKYTDKKVADLIGSAPETMDTLEEVATAIQENKDVETALNEAIGKKANQTELDTHTGNSTIHITASERTNWNAAKTHADSTHARTDATKVEKSSTNGNIKINDTETTVYTHPGSGTNPHGTTKSDVGLGDVGNFKAVSTVASQKLSDDEKANARANIGAGTSSFSGSYNDLSNKPTIPTNNNQLTNGAGYITSSGTAKTISDTLPISKGGTGKTTGVDAANTLINSLSTGDSTPTDADYYISQYVGGGTTTTTYHRRPMSALWNYIKSKADSVYSALGHTHTKSQITDFPTKVSSFQNDSKYQTDTDVTNAIDDIHIGGRNMIIKSKLSVGYLRHADGSLIDTLNNDYRTSNFIYVNEGDVYTISWREDSAINEYWLGLFYYKSDKTLLYYNDEKRTGNPFIITITVPKDCKYLRIYWQYSKGEKVKLEKGNKATDWSPAPEDTEAEIDNSIIELSMLGWSVPKECPIQNEVNGNQFIQKVGRVNVGNLSWEYIQSFTAFRFSSLNKEYLNYGIKQHTILYLYGFNYIGSLDRWSNIKEADEKSIAGVWAGGADDGFIIKSTIYTDTASFKQAMQGQYLYYELATPITTTIDGNEIGETVSDVRKETTVNLLKPTFETITKNGITCTNNGDGTYTLNGTATDNAFINLGGCSFEKNKTYKILGWGNTKYQRDAIGLYIETKKGSVFDENGEGGFYTPSSDELCRVLIVVVNNTTIPNAIIKPMLTTNLNSTYDDFVPYTGSTGQINSDVADIQSALDGKAASSHTHTKSQITDFPTSLPASDVYSWAKASSKPSYTKSEVGLGNVDNTSDANKSVKYATSAGSANSAIKASGVADYNKTSNYIKVGYDGSGITGDEIRYIAGYTTGDSNSAARIKDVSKDALKSWLGLGSLAYSSATIPTIPSSLPANGGNASTVNGHTVNADVPSGAKFTDTTYTSKSAVSGGTDVSLVTTGEKATWNAKTSNAGTITGIKMNGASKGTSGVVDLGTVLTGGSQTSTSDEDGGENVYTFSDGSTITIKNGTRGDAGTGGSNRLTYYETRPTSANKASSSDRVGSIEAFIASSKMTTGKPSADAKILQMNWDNTSGWDSQLAMLNDGTLQHRSMSNGTWKNWKTVLDNNTGTWTPRIFDTASNEVRVGAAFGRYYVLGDMVFIDAILGIDGSCVCHHISGLPYVPDENRPSKVYPIRIASLSMGTNSPFNYIRGGDSWYVQNMAYASKDISDTWYVSGWYKKA